MPRSYRQPIDMSTKRIVCYQERALSNSYMTKIRCVATSMIRPDSSREKKNIRVGRRSAARLEASWPTNTDGTGKEGPRKPPSSQTKPVPRIKDGGVMG